MASAGHNLATLSPAKRMDIAVDLIARRLIHFRKDKGKAWREWVKRELAEMDNSEQVRTCLNKRLGV